MDELKSRINWKRYKDPKKWPSIQIRDKKKYKEKRSNNMDYKQDTELKEEIFKEMMTVNILCLMKDTMACKPNKSETKNIKDKESMLKLSEKTGRLPTE